MVIRITQGEDWARKVEIFEEDGVTPLDLTGHEVYAYMKRWSDVPERVELTATERIVDDLYHAKISLTRDQTRALDDRRYKLGVWVAFPEGGTLQVYDAKVIVRTGAGSGVSHGPGVTPPAAQENGVLTGEYSEGTAFIHLILNGGP